jgi:acyl carrier protein
MTDDIRALADKVRSFILSSFLTEGDAETLGDDDDLLKVLDSLQILRRVITFEKELGIKVEDGDMTVENLGSVRKVAALIARKRGGGQPAIGEGLSVRRELFPKVSS